MSVLSGVRDVSATVPADRQPLTPGQVRFAIYQTVVPEAPVHTVAATIRAPGRLDVPTLNLALSDLLARHDALRLRLSSAAGVAVAGADGPASITVAVARAGGADDAQRLIAAHARADCDLSTGRPLRALLVELPEESVLCLAAHRLAVDHASLVTLVEQLAARYAARQAGDTGSLDPAPAFFQAGPHRPSPPGPETVAALQAEYADALVDIRLPARRARPATPQFRGAQHRFQLPAELVARLRDLGTSERSDLSTVVLAGLHALLHRYSRQDAIMVGVELDRRPGPGAVGPYADLVLVGCRHRPQATFRDLVAVVRDRLAAGRARPPIPLNVLADALGQRIEPAQLNLCRVAFTTRPAPAVDGWQCELVAAPTAEFDLELAVAPAPGPAGDLPAVLRYDSDLFDEATAAGLARRLLVLLDAAAGEPHRTIGELPLLTAEDTHLLLTMWSGSADLRPTERPVHEILQQRAAEHPDAVALRRGADELTYGTLNARANQLARELQDRGVRPESVVAICMDRSAEWLTALLAAYKIGAIAALLDPRAPAKRHELALATSQPLLVLTLDRLGVQLPTESGRILLVDREWPDIGQHPDHDLGLHVDLDHLAYLVQTSGSTGTPKAVGVPHRALAHCSEQQAALYDIRPEHRTTWFAPPGASVAIIEIWPYLCAGASLHIAEPEVVATPVALRDWLVGNRITHSFVIAAVAEVLWSLEWPDDCALTLMTTGGEKVRRWAAADLPFEVANTYGSAEASYLCSCLQPWELRLTSVTATDADRQVAPPIGRPWPGVKIYIVDDDLNLMPPGAVGELCVDSPELAWGYLGDPVKTALKFVPNPFPGARGSRLYRTGDLVRHRPDGILEIKGREDTQVKIRGFRVEAAEVEAALLEHGAVAEAVVAAVPDPTGAHRLVAYVIKKGDLSFADLRTFAAERLPDYMVPTAYVAMTALPLNTTGKVDRLALPAPDWESSRVQRPYQAPRDEIERAVLALWAEILQVSNPGMNDDFFDLGGNSLLAGRLLGLIRERLSADLELGDIFRAPSPAALAARVREGGSTAPTRALPEVKPARRR